MKKHDCLKEAIKLRLVHVIPDGQGIFSLDGGFECKNDSGKTLYLVIIE